MLENRETRGWFWVTGQLVLLIVWGITAFVGERYYPEAPLRYIIQAAGLVLTASGLVLMLVAAFQLRENFTPNPEPRSGSRMTAEGLYKRARHPIYGGVILVVLGLTVMVLAVDALYVVPAIVVFFYGKSAYEEVRLRERFREYAEYARRTKRFIPFLW